MWLSGYLLPLFALSLVIGLGKADISDLFTLLQGEGKCETKKEDNSSSDVDKLNEILQDVQTLADGFRQAITVAQTEPTEPDGKVARQLLESWLGVKIDENGEVDDDDDVDTVLFEKVRATSQSLDQFLTDEGFAAPATPPNLICGGTGFVRYEWEADLLRWNETAKPPRYAPVMAGDQAVRLFEVYPRNDKEAPYLFDELHTYFSFNLTSTARNVCQKTDGARLNGVTVAGWTAIKKRIRGERFEEDSVAPMIIMCPETMAHTGRLATAVENEALNVVGQTTVIDLSSAVVAPATLFHEMIHLVSFWDEDEDGYIVSNSQFVKDYSYDPNQIILWNYAAREYVDDEGKYPREKSASNAESYTFFALSWWWYVQNRENAFYLTALQYSDFNVQAWLDAWDAAFEAGDSDGTGESDDDSYVGSGSEARKRWLRRALRSGPRSEFLN